MPCVVVFRLVCSPFVGYQRPGCHVVFGSLAVVPASVLPFLFLMIPSLAAAHGVVGLLYLSGALAYELHAESADCAETRIASLAIVVKSNLTNTKGTRAKEPDGPMHAAIL